MRILPLILLSTVLFCITPARADDESCASCDRLVQASGQFKHYKTAADIQVQGAPANDPAAYSEEVNGSHFTITASHLPAGKLTVIIGEAETFYKQPGERLFDVTCDGTTLAKNFDIIAAAGAPNKVCTITAQVDHQADSVHGPLILTFDAVKHGAKFNTLEILDASGNALVSLNASDLADPLSAAASKAPVVDGPVIWKDPTKPLDDRIHDLISRMSLAEKVQQIRNTTPGIPRLGVPAYDFWSEALHGVGFAGTATVFPQAIGAAATWDTPLMLRESDVISTEARAKFNDYTRHNNGNGKRFYCLTFWSPNVNIFRDPRWGRGQETYGEDPFLTGSFAVAFIHGLQGDNPKYIKAMGCAKHYAVHSGPEPKRHEFDATPPERDLYETYLPQFEMAVRQGHVGGVMGAYSALDGVPCCANSFLLTDILRKQWGFDGYIVSDCDAVGDIYRGHHYTDSPQAAAAAAVKAGCDICCGGTYNELLKAVEQKLITEPEIDRALYYALKTRFRLGLFDPPEDVPWSNIGIDQNDTPDHEALALKVAEESMVLLKNDGTLPLDRDNIKRIAVIGENADSVPVLVGNYNGVPARPVTILDGIKAVAGPNIQVTYTPGCPLALAKDNSNAPTPEMTAQALADAKAADVVIYVGGITAQLEGEESRKANGYIGFYGGDRTQIELPSVQTDLLKALQDTGKPVVFVNCSGSAMAMPWEKKHLPAIVQAWYPGEQGGKAVGEVLFGDVNPGGRLPVTFYKSTGDLPDFEDYSMANRTYRYFKGKPLFAFGYGLSYTKFSYKNAELDQPTVAAGGTLRVSFDLENSGDRDGDEVAQIYFRHIKSAVPQPLLALCGFTRIHLAKGDTARVTMDIPTDRFRYWDTDTKQYVIEPGKYQLLIGSASDDIRLKPRFEITAAQ
ncbi:MAG TPA: glycoside hydrolase family 3 C-terminal domain-containing protein [Candidatus Sulfotelmatobacter sp.]|nr:glycoside hydrolase family 3 C-terminal domain-containing protein [Candidatus Sulfotelmatobacter sp.]